jgi:hypothetical protein
LLQVREDTVGMKSSRIGFSAVTIDSSCSPRSSGHYTPHYTHSIQEYQAVHHVVPSYL